MECEPAASAEVTNVALPELMMPEPRTMVPSLNVTVPEIVPGVVEVTVAVKVTA